MDETVYERGRTSSVTFAQIPEWVISECRNEVWLYARLSLWAGGTGKAVSLSVPAIAKSNNVSQRTVQNAIGALKRAGAIDVRPQHSDDGSRLPNLFVLHDEPPRQTESRS